MTASRDRTNQKIVLAQRPKGAIAPEHFRLEEEPVGEVGERQILIEADHLSLDAFIRTTLHERSFHQPVPVGGTLSALGVGRVLASADRDFAPGDAVFGPIGAQTHALLPGFLCKHVDEKRAPLTAYLGALGLTAGVTAYYSLSKKQKSTCGTNSLRIGKPK